MFTQHSTPHACRVAEIVIEEQADHIVRLEDQILLLQAQCETWATYLQVAQDMLRERHLKQRRRKGKKQLESAVN